MYIVDIPSHALKLAKREVSYVHGNYLPCFQGLTGLLQSPIRGAERHGLPGVFSGNSLQCYGSLSLSPHDS